MQAAGEDSTALCLKKSLLMGFFGHLDKGGHFLVQQDEVDKGDWTSRA